MLASSVDRRGRMTIPQELRKSLGLKEGDILLIEPKKGHFIVYTKERIKVMKE